MTDPQSPWTTLDSKPIHLSEYLDVYEDAVIAPDGSKRAYTYIKGRPYVLILASENDHLILVRQYRYNHQQWMTECPGGCIDENETPLQAAQRELKEETGFAADQWTELGSFIGASPATVFLAEKLHQTDDNEMAAEGIDHYIRMTRQDIDDLIATHQFPDIKTLAALQLLDAHQRRHT